MAIQIADGFQLRVAKPLDDRQNVETVAQLDPTYGYEGQIVYVKDIKQFYTCYKDENGSLAYKVMETGNGGGSGSSEKQIKDWVSGGSYLEGDYIYREGEIYRCLTSNSDVDFNETNWEQLTYGIDELSHIKFATSRTKTNIDEILNIGTVGVYYQLYDSNSTGTKPTNADKSGIVKTEVWDSDGKYAVQEYDEMNTGNRKYMRYFNIDTWSDWKELATMDRVPELTDINTKLTELENNQIKNLSIQHQSPNEVYVKITACNSNDFSKILFTDSYGGSILITGGIVTGADYKTIKVVRLTNGDWSSYNPSTNTLNKIQNVYLGGTDIYIKCGSYANLYIEGSFISAERVYSIPSDVTQLPILDLTQAARKRVYNSLEELNTAKGLSISFTNGEDNTMKIVDALSPIETFADYFDNTTNNNRFGIDSNTYGTDISLLTITKFNDNIAIIRAYMSNGKLLVRRYQNDVLQDWSYDKTDLTEINTKLTQLENTINEVGGGGIYQSGEVEVGKWVDGQTLYRTTISDSTERTFSSGTMMLDFFTLSRNEYTVVKLDGTFRMCAATDNSGAHTVYTLPYVDLDTNRQVHLVYTTQDRVRLSGKNLKDYKILGYDVSIYYYKK